jgi:hypothetical protein
MAAGGLGLCPIDASSRNGIAFRLLSRSHGLLGPVHSLFVI